ncbi:MAG: FISUMP domain-containing protein [Paludibacter sp.]
MKNLTPSRLIISTVFLMLFVALDTFAFDYNITFTASGAKTYIDYITVQNLTQGTTVTVPAGSALEVTAVNQVSANDESLHIYPNPIQNKATVSYYSNEGGNTQINVFGVDGRNLVGMNKNLSFGINQFELTLPKGAYTLQINENGKLHTTKILSQSNNVAGIEFKGTENVQANVVQRVKATTVPMQYNYGDFLLFKAYSGNYVSILTDIITGNKTINFNFVECKDVDGNYYSTVTIGNQVWMAENLKTSKYRNNIAITDKTNLSTWGTSTTEASSDYASPSNSTTYGKLYNWYAVSSTNNLSPLGWHIPTDAEWTSLSDFLGGLNLAGDKLKENGNLHWATANTTAKNSTGFTALPGGSRSTDNSVYDIGNIGYWWSITEGTTTNNAWYRSLSNQNGIVTRGYYAKSGGMSIRCLMGDLPILTTTSASAITATGFVSGGNISFDGNLPIISRGVCWSTNQNPTINDSKTSDGTGSDSFISSISGLTAQTT